MYGVKFTHEVFSAAAAPVVLVENDGKEIRATNYFESAFARKGLLYLSFSAGAGRLLVPPGLEHEIQEMATADYVILSRGSWDPGVVRLSDGSLRRFSPKANALEVMFEDHSVRPFALQISSNQHDLVPSRADNGRTDLELLVYGTGLKLVLRLPACYRGVSRLPYLRRWR